MQGEPATEQATPPDAKSIVARHRRLPSGPARA
jgi:hypothetical protein